MKTLLACMLLVGAPAGDQSAFSASNLPLVTYLFFAYKIMGNQSRFVLPQLPDWETTDRFDNQARAEVEYRQGPDAADDARAAGGTFQADRSH